MTNTTTGCEAAADKVERIEAIIERHGETCGHCAGDGDTCEILRGWLEKRNAAQSVLLATLEVR